MVHRHLFHYARDAVVQWIGMVITNLQFPNLSGVELALSTVIGAMVWANGSSQDIVTRGPAVTAARLAENWTSSFLSTAPTARIDAP